jgi:hypothetical protein
VRPQLSLLVGDLEPLNSAQACGLLGASEHFPDLLIAKPDFPAPIVDLRCHAARHVGCLAPLSSGATHWSELAVETSKRGVSTVSEKEGPEASERRLTPLEAAAKAMYDHAVKEAVKSIEEKKIDYQLIRSVEQNIERESDRSCAIILFNLIDELMQGLILAECEASVPRLKNRMFDPQSGMLPNSAKRIFFAMSLKWITRESCHRMNIIRKNEFAHNI